MKLENWLDSLKDNAKPTVDEAIEYIGDIFPLLKEFKVTIQDPIWHAEGDVHIHTDMVLNELYNIFETGQFVPTPDQRQILILAAILHDIAKPLVTKQVDGRIKASRHEAVGRDYLIYRLLELNLPSESYLEIINLVGYHQRPKLLVIKGDPEYKYFALAQYFNYELMYWLEVADLKGRTCDDKEETLLYLDEYLAKTKEVLKRHEDELKLIDPAHKDIALKYGTHLISTGEVNSYLEVYQKVFKSEETPTHFVMMSGLPGTGKSTYISKNFPDYTLISLDNIRALLSYREDQSRNKEVANLAKEKLKESLRNKENIIWDATNIRQEFREPLIQLAKDYGAHTEIVLLLDKEQNIRKKNKQRRHVVPDKVITRMKDSFQFINPVEAHKVSYIFMESK